MKWLVTAFEPFEGHSDNISLTTLREMEKSNRWPKTVIFHSPLAVSFDHSWFELEKTLTSHSDLSGVIALGEARIRSTVGLERIALNWIDARIPDNDGHQIQTQKIDPNLVQDSLWCQISWENFPETEFVKRSYFAGTFVCNYLMFKLLQWGQKNSIPTGFIHVPDSRRLMQNEITRGVSNALEFAMDSKQKGQQ